jgi:FlgD Ig-like domain
LQRVLTTVTLLGLLVATAAAFAITEHLKQIKSPVYGTLVFAGATPPARATGSTTISPVCHCLTSTATIRIKVRHRSRVTVTIVDSSGNRVATLASNELLNARSPHHWSWTGRTAAGAAAPDGVYYTWVSLPHQTLKFTNRIIVDTKPPEVLPASVAKPVLFAGPGRSVAIRYSFDEHAHAAVYLRGRLVVFGRTTQLSDKVKWQGTLGGRPLPAGKYVLSVGAQDLAGNETPVAKRQPVTVVIRYVELSPERITVRSGGRIKVHVTTAARRYTWRLGQRHGARHGRVLRLRAPTTAGTYRLVVTEDGQSTTAVVRVHG